MASALRIDVYASLPLNVAPGNTLDLDPTNWLWVHCLAVPHNTLSELHSSFSQKPYKWLRYSVGAVVGAQGVLSTSQDSVIAVDDNATLPAKPISLYYHVSDEEKQRMLPVDPKFRPSQVTSSGATTLMAEFRDEVAERDGSQCVLSNSEESFCDAVHLVAHSKGDAYISTFTKRRSRDPAGGDLIDSVDDVRNGLFLHGVFHRYLGKSVAFLVTPNFAMDTTDIDPTASPKERRCTFHAFKPPTGNYYGDLVWGASGSKVRIADTRSTPTAILFDAVYAAAVAYHFGTQQLKDAVNATCKDTFYPGGIMNPRIHTQEERERAHDRLSRLGRYPRKNRNSPDGFDMLMALPYILVPPDEREAALGEARERAEEAEQRRVDEKVTAWIGQIQYNDT